MAKPTNDGNIVKRTSQYIDNTAFDETTQVPGTAIYGTPDDTNIYRAQVSSAGALKVEAAISTTGLATDSNQTDGSQKTQIVDAGGEVATVTGGKLDVNASIDTTGLATSTKQDSQTALLTTIDADTGTIATEVAGLLTDTELRATPVQVSGTVTATPTGTQNVDVTANTIGLATSAKQDTIIGHVDGLETLAGSTNSLLTTIDADTGNLPTIETNTDYGTVTGGGTETGALRVTVANNSTGVLSVDDNGSSLTVDGTVAATQSGTWTEANSAAIKTAVETIDNAISGSEMQVDVVGALPAGTNAIGKLAANSGVDIGDVDVTSTVLPTGSGTSAITSVNDTASSTTLKASNTARKQIMITNTSSAVLYVKYGATASTSSYSLLLNRYETLIEDHYNGIIDGIWASDPGDGVAMVTEIT